MERTEGDEPSGMPAVTLSLLNTTQPPQASGLTSQWLAYQQDQGTDDDPMQE